MIRWVFEMGWVILALVIVAAVVILMTGFNAAAELIGVIFDACTDD